MKIGPSNRLRIIIFILFFSLPIMSVVGMGSEREKLLGYFPESYESARAEFRKQIDRLKAKGYAVEAGHYLVPSAIDNDLTIDYLYLKPQEKTQKLILITSGVHGPEAPLGSALEIAFLDQALPLLERKNLGILIIHSLNPFGHKYHRRPTEINIDLNRNFLATHDQFNLRNADYEKNRDWMNKREVVKSPNFDSMLIVWNFVSKLLTGASTSSELRHAFAGGQYQDPKGIYYGGQNLEPQVLWMRDLFLKVSKDYSELLYWDFHTGLGEAAQLQLIAGVKTLATKNSWTQRIFSAVTGIQNLRAVSDSTPGFYPTSGDIIDYIQDLAESKGMKAATFTAEFGTLGGGLFMQLATSARILLENRGYHVGYATERAKGMVQDRYRELFNPTDKVWRYESMATGLRSMKILFRHFENLHENSTSQVNSFELLKAANE